MEYVMADGDPNFNISYNFNQGVGAQGVGQGYLDRGFYECTTTKVELRKTKTDKRFLYFTHKVNNAYVVQEDGSFKNDQRYQTQNREITTTMFLDPSDRADSDYARQAPERALKGSLAAHGHFTREQAEQTGGQVNLSPQMWINRACFVQYDPPPEGSGNDDYPSTRQMDRETVMAVVQGERTIKWPWDSRKPASAANAAMGNTAAGNMLPNGMKAGNMPMPSMGAPKAPAAPAAPVVPAAPSGFGGFSATPTTPAAPAGFGGAPTQQWGG